MKNLIKELIIEFSKNNNITKLEALEHMKLVSKEVSYLLSIITTSKNPLTTRELSNKMKLDVNIITAYLPSRFEPDSLLLLINRKYNR